MEKITITFDKGICTIEGAYNVSEHHIDCACRELKAIQQNRIEDSQHIHIRKKRGFVRFFKKFIRTLKKTFSPAPTAARHYTVLRPLLIEPRCK